MRARLLGLAFTFLAAGSLSAGTFTVPTPTTRAPDRCARRSSTPTAPRALDTIAFNVSGAGCDGGGVCTITPASQLPNVSSPVLIDGYTQPGAQPNTNAEGALNTVLKIVLSGATTQATGLGFTTGADASTVRGLVLNGGWSYAIAFALRRYRRVRARLLHRHRRRGDGGAEPAQRPRDRRRIQPRLHGGRAVAGGPEPRLRQRAVRHHVLPRSEPAHPGQSRRHRQVGDGGVRRHRPPGNRRPRGDTRRGDSRQRRRRRG